MACPKCGWSKVEGANFCVKCGYQFSKDAIEEYKDAFQMNYGISVVVGICSGFLAGIGSSALTSLIKLDWWGWIFVLIATFIGGGALIYSSYKRMEGAAIRQLRRRYN